MREKGKRYGFQNGSKKHTSVFSGIWGTNIWRSRKTLRWVQLLLPYVVKYVFKKPLAYWSRLTEYDTFPKNESSKRLISLSTDHQVCQIMPCLSYSCVLFSFPSDYRLMLYALHTFSHKRSLVFLCYDSMHYPVSTSL